MKPTILLLLLTLGAAVPAPAGTATLTTIASFSDRQVTGVAVSKTGRIFVNFPDWSDDHSISVAEIVDGKPVPSLTKSGTSRARRATISFACRASTSTRPTAFGCSTPPRPR